MTRPALPIGAALLGLAALAAPALAAHTQISVVRFHNETTIAAPSGRVWSALTTGRNLVTYCPVWKSEKNARVTLLHVGDVLDYRDAWGNGGRSIVTYIEKGRELRVAHEPQKGDYMCQAKFVLTPEGTGTKVDYWEQYTDESKDADREATAARVEADMASMMSGVKESCEKPRSRAPHLRVTR
jgi:uncharacterized protein YndB with AHSA1/START domain